MKFKTSELIGAPLDWAVRFALKGSAPADYVPARDNFSTCWGKGGPIIEREEINLEIHEGGHTRASFYRMRLTFDGRAKHYHHQHGPTPLIAAMRCYVSSKLGDEVDVHDELLQSIARAA